MRVDKIEAPVNHQISFQTRLDPQPCYLASPQTGRPTEGPFDRHEAAWTRRRRVESKQHACLWSLHVMRVQWELQYSERL
jgi:hypothetical protein